MYFSKICRLIKRLLPTNKTNVQSASFVISRSLLIPMLEYAAASSRVNASFSAIGTFSSEQLIEYPQPDQMVSNQHKCTIYQLLYNVHFHSRRKNDSILCRQIQVHTKLTLDNDTFENTGKSRFFERRTSRVLY